jgi:hypothetical protein
LFKVAKTIHKQLPGTRNQQKPLELFFAPGTMSSWLTIGIESKNFFNRTAWDEESNDVLKNCSTMSVNKKGKAKPSGSSEKVSVMK